MALVDTFTGRESPVTKQAVVMRLYRLFNPVANTDVWALELLSGNKHEYYPNLTYTEAQQKWSSNKMWWS